MVLVGKPLRLFFAGALALVAAQPVLAEIQVMPRAGQAVGVCTADQAGKWLVLTVDRATFSLAVMQTESFEGGKVCVWSGRPGIYCVVFDGADGNRETANVTLGGSAAPHPPPPPDPKPVPDGLWGLTKLAYSAAREHNLPTMVGGQVGLVAENYAQCAVKIQSGEVRDHVAARAFLTESNRTDVRDEDRKYWKPWDSAITTVLAAHDAELKADVQKIATAYLAISDGLLLSR